VEVQDLVMETCGIVEGETITIMTSLEHQKKDRSVKKEGLVTIKNDIEAVEVFKKIPLVVVMLMW